MEDQKIIELYWARSEAAISETSRKYSGYCYRISFNILSDNEDAEECTNDTYLRAWEAMPPKRPECLPAFLGRITRNLSLNKFRQRSAQKRGGGQLELALSELEECIPSADSKMDKEDREVLIQTLNSFLSGLPETNRVIFVKRYWYLYSIREISKEFSISESKAKSLMFRMRKQLRACLEKEGIAL